MSFWQRLNNLQQKYLYLLLSVRHSILTLFRLWCPLSVFWHKSLLVWGWSSFFSEKCANTKSARTMKNYTCLKNPWPGEFNYAKIFAKFLGRICKNLRKISLQKSSNLLPCVEAFQRSKNFEIQWLEVGLNLDLVW